MARRICDQHPLIVVDTKNGIRVFYGETSESADIAFDPLALDDVGSCLFEVSAHLGDAC